PPTARHAPRTSRRGHRAWRAIAARGRPRCRRRARAATDPAPAPGAAFARYRSAVRIEPGHRGALVRLARRRPGRRRDRSAKEALGHANRGVVVRLACARERTLYVRAQLSLAPVVARRHLSALGVSLGRGLEQRRRG